MLKKHNLPQDALSSYRPISYLNFISKVLERIIHARISSHLESFPSITPFQSAYQQFHSTETPLLCIQNYLLLAINKQKVSALVLLDLSAAFDTIDHKILLSRLSSFYGLSNTALNLIASYLLDQTQSVSIQSIPLLLPPFSQVYHRVLSLALFSFHCTQALSVKSLQRLQFHIIYMLTTRKFTLHFHPTSLMTVSPCSPPPLTKFMPGSHQIVFRSTHRRLNSS